MPSQQTSPAASPLASTLKGDFRSIRNDCRPTWLADGASVTFPKKLGKSKRGQAGTPPTPRPTPRSELSSLRASPKQRPGLRRRGVREGKPPDIRLAYRTPASDPYPHASCTPASRPTRSGRTARPTASPAWEKWYHGHGSKRPNFADLCRDEQFVVSNVAQAILSDPGKMLLDSS